MHYIRCNHCQKLIEVKSQYMTFCPECQYKLDNSFTSWQIQNPGKSYADYLSEVTVSDSALEGVKEQRKIGKQIGRSKAARRMGWALGVALVAAIIGGSIYWFAGRNRGSESIKDILSQTWKISYYEDLGATLKFPYQLETESSFTADSLQSDPAYQALDTAQQQEKQVILSAINKRWSEAGVISVTASRIDYKPDFGVNREVATGQILMGMLNENGLQGFEYFRNDYTVPNVKARSLSGNYLLGPKAFEFRALMAQYEHTVWYFMVAYPRSEPEGLLVAERFFNGILLDRKLQ